MKALVLALTLAALAQPQETKGTPEARARLDEARTALKANDFAKARSAAADAIRLDPNCYDAHQQFISAISQQHTRAIPAELTGDERTEAQKKAREAASQEMIAAYGKWAGEFPKSPVVTYMVGDLQMYRDYDKVEAAMRKALELDPKYSRAWFQLALIEEVRGSTSKYLEDLAKAADASPDDPNWAFYYASSIRAADDALWRKKSLEVARRFPDSERGAQALYWLSFEAHGVEDQIGYGELLRRSFPPDKFSWSSNGMDHLFDLYVRRDPAKAQAIAEQMDSVTSAEDKKTWQARLTFIRNLIQARGLIAAGKPDEAGKLLESTQVPRYIDASPLHISKADAADAIGNTESAYRGLLKLMSDKPTDGVHEALMKYGRKLGKTPAMVAGEVRSLLEAQAIPATDFSLPRYGDSQNLSIADYRGKVVLLNFWYPFCGPCRGEFPYLQRILDKYGPRGFVILSPNVHPNEDQFVLPYVQGMHYGFIPVQGGEEFASKAYQARGFPANFLIDQKGRVVYKPGVIRGEDAMRTMELQIEALLER